jgi:hypothetical protein
MKYWLALATAFMLAASGSSVIAGGVPLGVHYIGHDKVAAEMVKGGRILEENGLIVIANRGVMRGAEIQGRRDYHSGEDAALVERYIEDWLGWLLRREYRAGLT